MRGRTAQSVNLRRGGSGLRSETNPASATTPVARGGTTGAGAMGYLIDFGDDSEPGAYACAGPGPGSARTAAAAGAGGAAAASRKTGRQPRGEPPQQVELVTFAPADPFALLLQQSAAQPPPPQLAAYGGGGAAVGGPVGRDGRQPQHPLEFGFRPDGDIDSLFPDGGGDASAASYPGRRLGSLPAPFGSFSDLLGPVTELLGGEGGGEAEGREGANSGFADAHGHEHGHVHGYAHSQSVNGIEDLLERQRAAREAEATATGAVAADRSAASRPQLPGSAAAHSTAAGRDASPAAAAGGGETPTADPGGGGGDAGSGDGYAMGSRELLLYALPLFRDRLVFLPVVGWREVEDTSTVLGKVNAGVQTVQAGLSSMWHGLKDKGKLPAKIYAAGQAILENMNAEERLMRNIPRKANKLVVHHPASIPPDEIQDQLTALTSSFCYKSAGKAAVAGVMLPVAVGLEVLAVPGIGWYTAYQLFKSTSAAAGGSRLNTYLKADKSEVRVCYVPNPKMDLFLLKARLSPDGVLGGEDIEDLVHELRQPGLSHPLTELRGRHLRKTQTMKADYALLPMSAPDVDEQYGSGAVKKNV